MLYVECQNAICDRNLLLPTYSRYRILSMDSGIQKKYFNINLKKNQCLTSASAKHITHLIYTIHLYFSI